MIWYTRVNKKTWRIQAFLVKGFEAEMRTLLLAFNRKEEWLWAWRSLGEQNIWRGYSWNCGLWSLWEKLCWKSRWGMDCPWAVMSILSQTSQLGEDVQIPDTGMCLSLLPQEAVGYHRRSSLTGRQAGGMSCNSFPLTHELHNLGEVTKSHRISVDLFVIYNNTILSVWRERITRPD